MFAKFKQKCSRCRKNYVTTTYRNRFPVCYECQKGQLEGEIKDPEIKKLLDIPHEFYEKNAFLRDIKIGAIRYGRLSEKQIDAFKKSVKKLEEEEKKPKEIPGFDEVI
ncbi:MAG: hypothetical protein ABH879_01295 [archaeon]